MNIFVLDLDPKLCARYHCDKHVIKMILESAQLLSSTNRYCGLAEGYASTHINHPCAKWARESLENYIWLSDLAFYLNQEYMFRYNKNNNHKSFDVICSLSFPNLPDIGITKRPQCMPEQYKHNDPVVAYRNYYIQEKYKFCTWKNTQVPEWFLEGYSAWNADTALKAVGA